jgi:hypothetical protein
MVIRPEPTVAKAALGLIVALVMVNTISEGPNCCGWMAG